MSLTELLFWLMSLSLLYTYAGYPLVLYVAGRITGKRSSHQISQDPLLPLIVHVIPAFNEEQVMVEKLENSISMDYPRNRMRIIVVADGSSDNTCSIVQRYPQVEMLFHPLRQGKAAAVNRALAIVDQPCILVFSDANAMLNKQSLRLLVPHFVDPCVGGISGEKRVIAAGNTTVEGEGFYWRYESILKRLESDIYSVVGAAGELFSMRRELFEKIPADIILDDLYLSLKINQKGYLVKYDQNAHASEVASPGLVDEWTRKVRISAGAFQAISLFRSLLNPLGNWRMTFMYISHRIMRWVICPIAIPILLIMSIPLWISNTGSLIKGLLVIQLLFCTLAFIGGILALLNRRSPKIFHIPFYFFFMNAAVWAGFLRYINGNQASAWEKAKRASV